MAGGARVENIESLTLFKVALVKFIEACTAAMGDAESDVQRIVTWLENEQQVHWTVQIRHCQENLARAEEALRQKKLYKDSTGRVPSAVEEQKAVTIAKQKLEYAQQKLANTKRWQKQMQKEALLFKGGMTRFQTTISSDVPSAIAHLGMLVKTLEDYLAVKQEGEAALPPELAAYFGGPGAASMARGKVGGEAPGHFAALRGKSPSVSVRDATAAAAQAPGKTLLPEIPDAQRQTLSQIEAERSAPASGDKIIVDTKLTAGSGIFLERAKGSAAGDSGWFVGPSGESEPGGYETVSVADLISARPEFEQLLSLPPGFLVVIEPTGIATVLNDKDEKVWKEPAKES